MTKIDSQKCQTLNDLIHENECQLLQIFNDEKCDDSHDEIFLDETIEIINDDHEVMEKIR
jgi:hypothetical protein